MGSAPGVSDRPIRCRFAVDGRVRSGCLTCKARKKKCDGQISTTDNRCQTCIRLGLVCEQAPLRHVAPRKPRGPAKRKDSAESSRPSSIALEEGSPYPDFRGHDIIPSPPDDRTFISLPVSSDGVERHLLKYFLNHVAPLCSILQQGGNSFSSVLLPMAIIDPALLHALFIYASVHFGAAGPTTLPLTPHARLTYESQVTRGLSRAIAQNSVSESTIACALVVSTAEVIGGDTSRWSMHLRGAGHLISHLGASHLLQTGDGSFLLRYFAYHDIMAALSTSRRPSIDGVYWVEDVGAPVRSADSFMGLGHHLFQHIAEVCSFICDSSENTADSTIWPEKIAKAEQIAQALHHQDLNVQVNSTTDAHLDALVHHAEAFRFAALFHLYRHLALFYQAEFTTYEMRMDECVTEILRLVALVPLNLYCEIGLLFPLFMAGVGCQNNAEKIQYIQNRLEYIETWTKFKHVTRVRELLQSLWSKGRMDWEVMLREMGWHMSLA